MEEKDNLITAGDFNHPLYFFFSKFLFTFKDLFTLERQRERERERDRAGGGAEGEGENLQTPL